MDETVEHLILECERYEPAISKTFELVIEDKGMEERHVMTDTNDSRQTK